MTTGELTCIVAIGIFTIIIIGVTFIIGNMFPVIGVMLFLAGLMSWSSK